METRWQEIQNIWKSNQALFVFAGFLAGMLFFPGLQALSSDAGELLAGFVPEALGIAFTVLLIDRLNQRRERERERKEDIARLRRQVSSKYNDIALRALEEITQLDLLSGDNAILKRMLFEGTDLQDANLERSDLRRTLFLDVNLSSANLQGADLEGAYFMHDVNLAGADLLFANLTRLSGINKAYFDPNTTLPDGRKWSAIVDLDRYVNPNHEDFFDAYKAAESVDWF